MCNLSVKDTKGLDELIDFHSIVFEYSFGKESNILTSPENAASVRSNLTGLLRGAKLYKHFRKFFWAVNKLPISIS